jgi:hypothetical protein
MTARAAVGSFPYAYHRTVAEVDAAETAWDRAVAKASLVRKGPGLLDKLIGRDPKVMAPISTLPDGPCPRCGARGWCAHRSAAA